MGPLGLLALGVGLLLGGCFSGPTEVVVVADTDLTPGADFDVIFFNLFPRFAPGSQAFNVGTSRSLPATMGFLPQEGEGGPSQFDVVVSANNEISDPFNGSQSIEVLKRRVSSISFTSGEIRVVLATLLRKCLCTGTTCPSDLACRDVVEPKTEPFDENHLPRLVDQAP